MMAEDTIRELSYHDCIELLRVERVGRIGIVVDDQPIVLPINYRLVETDAVTWIAVRTRPGNVLDQPGTRAAFEIDGFDRAAQRGWSVLVRGELLRVDCDAADFRARFDPAPWVEEERESWLVIDPFMITGRVISGGTPTWAFVSEAYL
jgi:nitroimidazol reductase NimA-like FMN-containing flavoprotein (pyridoxamine 5'-phosphate oxidase superfamily)